MNMYAASFGYSHPASSHRIVQEGGCMVHLARSDPDPHAAGKALAVAERALDEALDGEGISHALQYHYPDGSLYEYVRTEGSVDELQKAIQDALEGTGVRLLSLEPIPDSEKAEVRF